MITRNKLGQFIKGGTTWNKGLVGFRSGIKSHFWKGGQILTSCKQCKKEFTYWATNSKGMYCSKTCSNIANAKKKEKNPAWRGGVTPIHRLIRVSSQYKNWRKAVFERDNYTCIWCGITSSKGKKAILHADHIKPFAFYPELRFDINNGRTLCVECHRKTSTYGRSGKRLVELVFTT